jgi:hypothetical protein
VAARWWPQPVDAVFDEVIKKRRGERVEIVLTGQQQDRGAYAW